MELRGWIGEKEIVVQLSQPLGSGGGYHIMIDNYYNGIVCKTLHGWKVYLNPNSILSEEDAKAIIEAVQSKA